MDDMPLNTQETRAPLAEYVVPEGLPLAVFTNKYSRRKPDGTFQTWKERVREVVAGNFMLDPGMQPGASDYAYRHARADLERTTDLAIAGIMPFSGRHLQHGDVTQSNRLLELFSNCSTTLFSFQLFRLLLRGSGVGRDYSSACCRVNWDNMPNIRLVLDSAHPDFRSVEFSGFLEPLRDAHHKYDSESEDVRWFTVGDLREGWSKVAEILETAAFQGKHADKLFVFDFSQVRPQGSPIGGLQGRPASGPVPLMNALAQIATIKGAGMKPWKQALFIDHYLAACVVWGGARRAARMATKSWRDRDVLEFIDIKRGDRSRDGGFLWSANNSILVDHEFWDQASRPQHTYARRVFEAAVNAAYWDHTGEPGFINVDMLHADDTGIDEITGRTCIDPEVYGDLHPRTMDMIGNVLEHVKKLPYRYIVNPCGEIVLALHGGLCIIGDVNLSRVRRLIDALDAGQLMAKFLIRCNRMKSEYATEVKRTNRIGVALTGIHEFAWTMFGCTFDALVDYYKYLEWDGVAPESAWFSNSQHRINHKAHDFWMFIDSMRQEVEKTAANISVHWGMVIPHTVTTIKPSGTISKACGMVTEGAHLPALAYYLRWTMYLKTDPDLVDLKVRGYPSKDISARYSGHEIVGFPTRLPIAELMGDNITLAGEASIDDQYKWVRLLERFWLGAPAAGNQVSYTLKYDASQVSYLDFMAAVLEWQPKVRCCAVMPQDDWRATEAQYGYVPEQPITREVYEAMMASIRPVAREGYDADAMACELGACPIEPDVNLPQNSC